MMCFVAVASAHKLLMDRMREDGLDPRTIEVDMAQGQDAGEQGVQTPTWAPA